MAWISSTVIEIITRFERFLLDDRQDLAAAPVFVGRQSTPSRLKHTFEIRHCAAGKVIHISLVLASYSLSNIETRKTLEWTTYGRVRGLWTRH